MEKYQLLNGETLVLTFAHKRGTVEDIFSDVVVHEQSQLPMRLRKSCSERSLDDWISRRTIPVNRHHMEAVLDAINMERPFDVMRYSHALSLNDTFWIKEVNEDVTFAKINLYENKFDEALGWIAFTGLPSNISRNLSTPELTTEGVLPKFWQRIGFDDIVLVKGGTSGYANAGLEPYREVAAHIVAKKLGIDTIPYHLQTVSGKTASVSSLFTTKETGLLTAHEYIDHKTDIAGYRRYGEFLTFAKEDGIDLKPFYEMCLIDYIIENNDRHLRNWGFSVDNQSQTIKGIAPIWDNGNSLDFGRPTDFRAKFDFASFATVKYDFIKDCEYTKEFQSRVNKLIVAIKSGELFDSIYDETRSHYPDKELTQKTVDFVNERCLEFMNPLV
jgi:hypothetical protein